MAIHYCIHGSTFNGDGTASNEAASGGAVGAFNDAIACLSGTQVGIADGDTVIFQTNDGVSNLQVSVTSGFTILGAASGFVRNYIMDDGTVWANAGRLEFICTGGTGINILLDQRAQLFGGDYRFYIGNNTTTGVEFKYQSGPNYFDGVFAEQLDTTAGFNYFSFVADFFVVGNYGRAKYKYTKEADNSAINLFHFGGQRGDIVFEEMIIERVSVATGLSANVFFKFGLSQLSARFRIKSLTLINPPNEISLVSLLLKSSSFQVDSLTLNNGDYKFNTTSTNDCLVNIDNINLLGSGVGKGNFRYENNGIVSSFISGRNYPTQSSFLPNLIDKWSIRVDFDNGIVKGGSINTTQMLNYYDQASGVKTLTVEALIYDGIVNPSNDEFYCVFQYTDTTGVVRTESTRDTNPLPTSSAIWDTTDYGPINFNKHKFEITTQHQIQSGSMIHAETFANINVTDTTTFNFINPEIVVS